MVYSLEFTLDKYRKGDSRPDFEVRILESGEGVDLSASRSAELILVGLKDEVERTFGLDVDDDKREDGWLIREWGSKDLDIPSQFYKVYVEVKFGTNDRVTAPTEDPNKLKIIE